jgi:hypothetical protein
MNFLVATATFLDPSDGRMVYAGRTFVSAGSDVARSHPRNFKPATGRGRCGDVLVREHRDHRARWHGSVRDHDHSFPSLDPCSRSLKSRGPSRLRGGAFDLAGPPAHRFQASASAPPTSA